MLNFICFCYCCNKHNLNLNLVCVAFHISFCNRAIWKISCLFPHKYRVAWNLQVTGWYYSNCDITIVILDLEYVEIDTEISPTARIQPEICKIKNKFKKWQQIRTMGSITVMQKRGLDHAH